MAGSLRRRFHLRSPDVVELLDLLDFDACNTPRLVASFELLERVPQKALRLGVIAALGEYFGEIGENDTALAVLVNEWWPSRTGLRWQRLWPAIHPPAPPKVRSDMWARTGRGR